MQHEPMVTLGVRVSVPDWRGLAAMAERRGYRKGRGDALNISEAARVAINAGLRTLEAEAGREGAKNAENRV